MKIDINTEQGNIFFILGAFKRFKKKLEAEGTDTSEYQTLLDNFSKMEYDEILNEIERITKGGIQFIER